ncbi:B3 domain-containing transcription factor VRN1-like [Pistacia vera]|uniref:B3 domain-containing transcription factor VRN1-like n=1 Tax=Pistacia vera TaxID=55513 RepID=UPI001263AEDC|nr:B3 domain-containing transcription factor VRN1-like [Pistacia vera]
MPCTGRKANPITPNSLGEPPLHFFKVILPNNLAVKKLGIPGNFVSRFADELSAVAKLSIPNGHDWQVTIDGKNIWFQDGWHDFVQYYSVSTGYFLVFKHAKNSTFEVLIFDKTACEIQYPYNAEEAVNDVENSKFRPPSKNMHVPIKFVNKYISSKARFITLQISNEKEWLVRIKKFNTGGFRITKGWARFLKDNDLKGGDICIFELMIRKKHYLTLKVLVYHAAMKLT